MEESGGCWGKIGAFTFFYVGEKVCHHNISFFFATFVLCSVFCALVISALFCDLQFLAIPKKTVNLENWPNNCKVWGNVV